MELRDYQQECLVAIETSYIKGVNKQLICLPTGTGKTVIFCHLPKVMDMSCLIFVPRIELLYQTQRQFEAWFPDQEVSIFHGDTHRLAPITITTIQTAKKRAEQIRRYNFQMAIFDEAHHAVAKTYFGFLKEIAFLGDEKLLVGFTATPERTDKEGLDKIFTKITYRKTIPEMIEKSHLCPIDGFSVKTGIDLSSAVRSYRATSDDKVFNQQQLASVLNSDTRNDLITKTYLEHCTERSKGIAFCADVQHAETLSKAFRECGISSESISCYDSKNHRNYILQQFREGKIKVLCNRDILIEGFDEPSIDTVLLCRPTCSPLLYTQMIGRGTRLHPSKKNLLVVEFSDRNAPKVMTFNSLRRDFEESDEDSDSEHSEKTHFAFCSDGTVHIEKIDFNLLKRSYEQFESWKDLMPTQKQIDFCKLLYGGCLPYRGSITRKEISDYINNAKITDRQCLMLLKNGISAENMTYGIAKQTLDSVEPAIAAQFEELDRYYPNNNFRHKGLTRLKAQLLIENIGPTEYQTHLLLKYGVNPEGLTRSRAAQILRMIQERLASDELRDRPSV